MRLRPELLSLLRSVVRKQKPDLLPAVDRLDRELSISSEDKIELIRQILAEVDDVDFLGTDRSVDKGVMLFEIIEFLGKVKAEPADS